MSFGQLVGTALVAVSIGGFVGLAIGTGGAPLLAATPLGAVPMASSRSAGPALEHRVAPVAIAAPGASSVGPSNHAPGGDEPVGPVGRSSGGSTLPASAAPVTEATTGSQLTVDPADERLPITQVTIPSIGLDAPVVPARFVEKSGVRTWEVPAHVAGHADLTAGAGQTGNAVLLGHVDSVRSGDVFRNLSDLAVGQEIVVHAGTRPFRYRVTEIKQVPREDTSALATTDRPVLTLFNCAGTWLPTIWDYTERFVVRAELVE